MEDSPRPRDGAEQFTQVVESLPNIECDRKTWLATNPEGHSPQELNQQIPEINQIELDNSRSAAAAPTTLRIVAWNLERGRHWRKAVQLIQEHPALMDVDVLLVSEMDLGIARSGYEHTTRELATALGMNYAYGVEYLELSANDDPHPHGYHGNAILSRAPLENLRMLRMPGVEKWYGSHESRLGGRIALMADIAVAGEALTVVSTHLESGSDSGSAREQESRLILQALGDTSPVLVGGDFNATANTLVLEHFRHQGFLVDEANALDIPTFQLTENEVIRPGNFHIDYILVRGAQVVPHAGSPAVVMAAYPCTPQGDMISDHAAVTTVISLE